MSYNGTQSQTGLGTTISINTGTSGSPTWTPIGELIKFDQSGKKNNTDDATNLESTDEEFISTIPTPGNYAFTVNRVSSDAGQAALLAAFNSGALTQFQVQYKKSPAQTSQGDKQTFTALVEELNDTGSIEPKKIIQYTGSLKVSGPITFTAGS